jgi:DNA-binding PadR family transcriptional regulator
MVTTAHDMTDVGYWQSLNRKSLLRFFLFAALHERPMHGYEIATEVSVCCDGARPTDAMIYPTLKELESDGYIVCSVKSDGARQRRVCALTEKGEAAFRAAARAWAQALPQIESAVHAAGVTACCGGERFETAEISFVETKR